MPRHAQRSLIACLFLFAGASGCSFDDSHLEALVCLSDSDCAPGNVCISQRCQSASGARDQGEDFSGGDLRRDTDAGRDGAGPDAPGDGGSCEGNENVCGGCSQLPVAPGSACTEAACGIVICDGPDAVTCQARETNECGGCTTLRAAVGAPCSAGESGPCGGALVCDGTDELSCAPAPFNDCGGCADLGGAPGDPCTCGDGLSETHTLSCAGEDELRCGDTNGAFNTPSVLGDSDDAQAGAREILGGVVAGETEDWFQVFVRDVSGEALFPDVDLVDLGTDLDLCAYWTFTDLRDFDLSCDGGSVNVLDEHTRGCCSAAAGTASEGVGLRGGPFAVGRLDWRFGGDNDNGWLTIAVIGKEPATACSTYRVRFGL